MWKVINNIYYIIENKILNFINEKVFRKRQKALNREELQRIFRFVISGSVSTVVSYIVYVIIVFCGGGYFGGSCGAFVVGVLNNFYWNKNAVFKNIQDKNFRVSRAFIKNVIGYSISFIVQVFTLHIWIDVIGLSEIIAPILNVFIIVPLNYLINRFWIFYH